MLWRVVLFQIFFIVFIPPRKWAAEARQYPSEGVDSSKVPHVTQDEKPFATMWHAWEQAVSSEHADDSTMELNDRGPPH